MSGTNLSASADDAPHFTIDWLEDGAVFTLRRPKKLNSVTRQILDGLSDCLDELDKRGLRLLVITGEGEKSFCAGTDLAESSKLTAEAGVAKNNFARALFYRLSQAKVITVAAVNGLAFGGGMELAMACLFRVVAPHADMSLPEIKLGVLPTYGGTQFLPAIVGQARSLDIMLTGRRVGAAEAFSIGLATRIAEGDAPLVDQALALARSVTCYSQVAIDCTRACAAAAGPLVTQAGLDEEERQVAIVMESDDSKEGVRAFLEKRAPVFKHR